MYIIAKYNAFLLIIQIYWNITNIQLNYTLPYKTVGIRLLEQQYLKSLDSLKKLIGPEIINNKKQRYKINSSLWSLTKIGL